MLQNNPVLNQRSISSGTNSGPGHRQSASVIEQITCLLFMKQLYNKDHKQQPDEVLLIDKNIKRLK
jgi:hypothetical protein